MNIDITINVHTIIIIKYNITNNHIFNNLMLNNYTTTNNNTTNNSSTNNKHMRPERSLQRGSGGRV